MFIKGLGLSQIFQVSSVARHPVGQKVVLGIPWWVLESLIRMGFSWYRPLLGPLLGTASCSLATNIEGAYCWYRRRFALVKARGGCKQQNKTLSVFRDTFWISETRVSKRGSRHQPPHFVEPRTEKIQQSSSIGGSCHPSSAGLGHF